MSTTIKPMPAFHGSETTKAKYVERMRAHRKADELQQRIGFESNGKTRACAVGCTFDAYEHERGPVEIGYPADLMHLEDAIFEGLPAADAGQFAEDFLTAPKPGAELSLVWPRFAIWLLSDETHGTRQLCNERGKAATDMVVALHRELIDWREPNAAASAASDAALDARAAAWAAASDAAWAAASDAAWAASTAAWAANAAASSAAWAAASSAAWAASAAAWAANDAANAARAAASDTAYKRMSAKLIELLRGAPPSQQETT